MNNDFDMEKYIEMKRAEQQEVFQMLNEETREIDRDSKAYERYLDVQSRFDLYSVSNALLLSSQLPEATQLKQFDDWVNMGVQVNKGEKGIRILEPYEYDKSDGSRGRGYKVKKVFDVTQTNAMYGRRRYPALDETARVKALIENAPASIEVVDEVQGDEIARYDPEAKIVYLKEGCEPDNMFKALSREFAHAHFDLNKDNYTRQDYDAKAQSAAYMICQKYGVGTEGIVPDLPQGHEEMKPKELRRELNDAKRAVNDISGNIKKNLKRQKEAREDQER